MCCIQLKNLYLQLTVYIDVEYSTEIHGIHFQYQYNAK
jgi:hypothetical protein